MVCLDSPEVYSEYDLIFAGGGSTACVTAGRLAAADPSLKILILEAGPHSQNLPEVIVPGLFADHFLPISTTAAFYPARRSKELGDLAPTVVTGHCVGGGSCINWLMYSRAAASDYDEWKNTYGNVGWSSEDLLPLLLKSECYQVAPEKPTHGYTGPLKVSYGGMVPNYTIAMMDMVKEYDSDRGVTEDTNDLYTVNKWSRWAKWIDASTGKRTDVASSFIYNQESNDNLVVAAGYRVIRVLFESGRAVGIEYVPNPKIVPDAHTETKTARAKKLLILSAGSFGTPAILERSGIGSPTILKACNIAQVVGLPGVGAEYQDHPFVPQGYVVDESAETRTADRSEIAVALEEWKRSGSGILSTNTMDVGIKLRPDEKEIQTLGPVFEKYWHEYFANKPDKALLWFGIGTGLPTTWDDLPTAKFSYLGQFLMYPLSRGHVHIRSSNVNDTLDFDAGFLKEPMDLEILRWAYKRGREYSRRHPLYRGELWQAHPAFSTTAQAAVQYPPAAPTPMNRENLEYDAEDDRAIDEYIRKNVATTCHSMGTCPMKPRGQGGVVDPFLNVYGVLGLKVADLSIAPSNIGANTHSTAIVIGEKAAVIIARELGIEGV